KISEGTIMNDQKIKIEPPEYSMEDIKLENEFDDLTGIVKSESCLEDDKTCLERFMNSAVIIEEEVKHELIDTSAYACDIRERRFKCDICNQTFRQKANMKSHMTTHTKERPFKCDTCNKEFSQSNNLKRHKMTVHSGKRDEDQ
ncbi:zinc finger protein 22-like, partial [Ctenocephalides felis]|uniref:zinc finger protein 22-like n=1 Tax=Ctenocephalides felis TaxID=7515 RepID=UPI000E6E2339